MAQKFKKKTVEKRKYSKTEGVLKNSFGFISKLRMNLNKLQVKFQNFRI